MRTITAALVGLALVVAACSDDGGSGSDSGPAASGAPPVDTPLTVATLNVLHGLPLPDGCAPDTDFCHAPERMDLLWSTLEVDAGCPDVIALQETGPRQKELVPQMLGDLCAGTHQQLFSEQSNPDQEMILTTLPVVDEGFVDLSGPPWTAHWARLDTALGEVDVFSTHYASDSFNPDCSPAEASSTCSPVCPDGIEMGSCNALETVDFLDQDREGAVLQLVVGDLNQEIDHPRIAILTDAGFVDTWLLAGNPECGPSGPVAEGDKSGSTGPSGPVAEGDKSGSTGPSGPDAPEGCTDGDAGDAPLNGLDQVDQRLDARIDFVLARPADGCQVLVDTPDDDDGDGTATGLMASGPLDPPVKELAWFSDHQGVEADLGLACDTGRVPDTAPAD